MAVPSVDETFYQGVGRKQFQPRWYARQKVERDDSSEGSFVFLYPDVAGEPTDDVPEVQKWTMQCPIVGEMAKGVVEVGASGIGASSNVERRLPAMHPRILRCRPVKEQQKSSGVYDPVATLYVDELLRGQAEAALKDPKERRAQEEVEQSRIYGNPFSYGTPKNLAESQAQWRPKRKIWEAEFFVAVKDWADAAPDLFFGDLVNHVARPCKSNRTFDIADALRRQAIMQHQELYFPGKMEALGLRAGFSLADVDTAVQLLKRNDRELLLLKAKWQRAGNDLDTFKVPDNLSPCLSTQRVMAEKAAHYFHQLPDLLLAKYPLVPEDKIPFLVFLKPTETVSPKARQNALMHLFNNVNGGKAHLDSVYTLRCTHKCILEIVVLSGQLECNWSRVADVPLHNLVPTNVTTRVSENKLPRPLPRPLPAHPPSDVGESTVVGTQAIDSAYPKPSAQRPPPKQTMPKWKPCSAVPQPPKAAAASPHPWPAPWLEQNPLPHESKEVGPKAPTTPPGDGPWFSSGGYEKTAAEERASLEEFNANEAARIASWADWPELSSPDKPPHGLYLVVDTVTNKPHIIIKAASNWVAYVSKWPNVARVRKYPLYANSKGDVYVILDHFSFRVALASAQQIMEEADVKRRMLPWRSEEKRQTGVIIFPPVDPDLEPQRLVSVNPSVLPLRPPALVQHRSHLVSVGPPGPKEGCSRTDTTSRSSGKTTWTPRANPLRTSRKESRRN